jgi:hypothetical protein
MIMATLISNMVGDTTNGAAAKANRKAKGSATASSARRSAVGQRSSVADRFGASQGANIAKQQAVLRDRNSTPEQRAIAQRKIMVNTRAVTSSIQRDKGSEKVTSRFGLQSRAQQRRSAAQEPSVYGNSLGIIK